MKNSSQNSVWLGMRTQMKMSVGAAFLTSIIMLASAPAAHAISVTGFAGKYFGTNEGLLLGGEVTFSLIPMLDLGGFYEHSGESPSTHVSIGDESRSYYGVVGRFTLPFLPFFADLRLGPQNTSYSAGGSTSGTGTRLGVGYAYELIPGVRLMPRVGLALADTDTTYPTWDGSIGLSVGF